MRVQGNGPPPPLRPCRLFIVRAIKAAALCALVAAVGWRWWGVYGTLSSGVVDAAAVGGDPGEYLRGRSIEATAAVAVHESRASPDGNNADDAEVAAGDQGGEDGGDSGDSVKPREAGAWLKHTRRHGHHHQRRSRRREEGDEEEEEEEVKKAGEAVVTTDDPETLRELAAAIASAASATAELKALKAEMAERQAETAERQAAASAAALSASSQVTSAAGEGALASEHTPEAAPATAPAAVPALAVAELVENTHAPPVEPPMAPPVPPPMPPPAVPPAEPPTEPPMEPPAVPAVSPWVPPPWAPPTVPPGAPPTALLAPPPGPPRPPPLNPFTSSPMPPPDFDSLGIVRRLAGQFKEKCAGISGHFQEMGARYYRMVQHGVIIIDWSESYFNGIGDDMQHYQEMVAIGLGTGRAAYLKTQREGCVGTGMAGARGPTEADGGSAHLARECHFDLGDYYTGLHGVDWKWDDAKEARVREQLGTEEKELIVTWSTNGMYFGATAGHNEEVSPTGEYVAPPDANLIQVLMDNEEFKKHKIVRVRIKLNFGHWCHPHQRTSWGMCESHRWITGGEGHASKPGETAPCPECGVGGCFGAAMLQPRAPLKHKLAPYIAKMDAKKWSTMVAFHIRTGFADMSQIAPPDAARAEEATLDTIDAFLRSEAARVPYPKPQCPDERFGGVVGGAASMEDGPLKIFLRCVVSTAEVLSRRDEVGGDDSTWGVFMTTDSPAVRTAVETQYPQLAGKLIVTDGVDGNVKYAPDGMCRGCDASGPLGAWEKGMVDMYLVGLSDIVLKLYESKFTNAAIMRADVRHGIKHVYGDTRITHNLVDGLIGRMKGQGFAQGTQDDRKVWVKIWDLFGPPGERQALPTSTFATE